MSTRVLATDRARSAVGSLQQLLNGDLVANLQRLDREGATLCDPEAWDGREAGRFRSDTWPATTTALRRAVEAIEQLRAAAGRITGDIMTAGGNG